MPNSLRRAGKKNIVCTTDANTLIERLRKTRALSCSPSDVGMDSYMDWLTRYGKAYFLISKVS